MISFRNGVRCRGVALKKGEIIEVYRWEAVRWDHARVAESASGALVEHLLEWDNKTFEHVDLDCETWRLKSESQIGPMDTALWQDGAENQEKYSLANCKRKSSTIDFNEQSKLTFRKEREVAFFEVSGKVKNGEGNKNIATGSQVDSFRGDATNENIDLNDLQKCLENLALIPSN